MNLKLFYSPPKWMAFVPPEKPRTPFLDEDTGRSRKFNNYEKAYAEAKANALEVGNIHLFANQTEDGWFYAEGSYGGVPVPIKIETEKVYDWIGSAVIKDGKYILNL